MNSKQVDRADSVLALLVDSRVPYMGFHPPHGFDGDTINYITWKLSEAKEQGKIVGYSYAASPHDGVAEASHMFNVTHAI